MTEQNIASGEPMGVYKSAGQFDMFMAITFNNLLVAVNAYVLGIFFGVGTVMILIYNGVMVGTFQHYFVGHGLLQESFLTIWMHGAFEISAIIIAGGAGLALGRGIIQPRTLPRSHSFRLAARRSITIMLGLAPVFVGAAFIEGTITRLTDLPDVFRALFIVLCFAVAVLYFRIYPHFVFRRIPPDERDRDTLLPDLDTEVDLRTLRTSKEIFADTFVVFRKVLPTMAIAAPTLGVLYALAFYFIYGVEGLQNPDFTTYSFLSLGPFFDFQTHPQNFILNAVFLVAVVHLSLWAVAKRIPGLSGLGTNLHLTVKIAVVVCLFQLSLLTGSVVVAALGLASIPFLIFWVVVSSVENLGLPRALDRMFRVLSGTGRHVFITFLSGALVAALLLLVINAPLIWFYIDVLQANLHTDFPMRQILPALSLIAINFTAFGLVLPVLVYGQLLEYFSAVEASGAVGLSERVEAIGKKSRAYGLEKE